MPLLPLNRLPESGYQRAIPELMAQTVSTLILATGQAPLLSGTTMLPLP